MKSNNRVRTAVALMVLVIPATNHAATEQMGTNDKALKASALQASLLSPARGFTTHATFTDGVTYQSPPRAMHVESPARDSQAPNTAASASASHRYDTLFMMLGVFGLVVLQLRRKQNSLPRRPLSLPFDKPSPARQMNQPAMTSVSFHTAEQAV